MFSSKNDFELIFASSDRDEESFNNYFSKIPWLPIPLSDFESVIDLKKLFNVKGMPCLVLLDPNGMFLTDGAVHIIEEHGIEGYLFSLEKLKFLKENEEKAKREQTLRSVLVTQSRDFVISNEGKQVLVSELEGKIVGLYFSFTTSEFTVVLEFNQVLEEMYGKLKKKEESFEVVLISFDEDEEVYNKSIKHMPWLALHLKDSSRYKLVTYFELSRLPTLIIIGSDGKKTLQANAAELVQEFGMHAYPFTLEKLVEIEDIKKVKVGHDEDGKKDAEEEKNENAKTDPEESHNENANTDLEEENDEDAKTDVKEENGEDDGIKEAPEQASKGGWICDGDVCHRV